jgi:hypothetical protein
MLSLASEILSTWQQINNCLKTLKTHQPVSTNFYKMAWTSLQKWRGRLYKNGADILKGRMATEAREKIHERNE